MSKDITPPPSTFGKGQRGKPVVKPKDMKGTLRRLWDLTSGQRGGLGFQPSPASPPYSPLCLSEIP